MAKAKKKQPELAGMERPTIEALDSLCAEHLEAQSALADAKDHASDAKAALKACMEEHKKQLEQDADDNHIYVYQDGDERTNVVLYHEEGIRCRKEKKAKLELVEDGDID
jgi:hypothetical protein